MVVISTVMTAIIDRNAGIFTSDIVRTKRKVCRAVVGIVIKEVAWLVVEMTSPSISTLVITAPE